MECRVTGRHLEIGRELRDLIDQRLLPIERLLGDALVSAEMVLVAEHHQCVSEIVVHARGDHRLRGLAEGPNWSTSVGNVIHHAQTLKGKWQGRRRHATLSFGRSDGPVDDEANPPKDPGRSDYAILAAAAPSWLHSSLTHPRITRRWGRTTGERTMTTTPRSARGCPPGGP